MSLHPHVTRLRATVLGALVAVLVTAAACASSHHGTSTGSGAGVRTTPRTTSSPAGATVTTTRNFAPYDRGGVATTGVVARRSGSCFTTSITVSARNAYRCFAGNAILDPCFAAPGASRVLSCFTSPWSGATRLQVTKALPAATTPLDIGRPWALQLAGGIRCVATNGTPRVVHRVPLSYQCSDGAAGIVPDQAHVPLEHALYAASDGAVRTVAVDVAWRA